MFCLYLILSQYDGRYLLKRTAYCNSHPWLFPLNLKFPDTVPVCQCTLLLWTNVFWSSLFDSQYKQFNPSFLCAKERPQTEVNFDNQWIEWINTYSSWALFNKLSIQLKTKFYSQHSLYAFAVFNFAFSQLSQLMSCHQSLPLLLHWRTQWQRWVGHVSH